MLRNWFSSLPAFEPENADNFSALIERCRQEDLTGLLRLDSSSGDLYLWMFVNGRGRNLFKYENEKWTAIPLPQMESKLDGYKIKGHWLHIPVQGMRICEAVLAAEVEQHISLKMSGADLLQQLQVWSEGSGPSFIYVQAENQELFGLVYGDDGSSMEILFTKDSKVIFSLEQPGDLPFEAGTEYRVEFYIGNAKQEVWLKNKLRLAFTVLMYMMIQRFGYMVGFTLADRLCVQLTEANQARNLDIKLTTNGVKNDQFFHSLLEAGEAYSFILSVFFDQAGILIGPRLSKEIAMNMLEKLSPAKRELLVTCLHELRGPQIHLASIPRK